MTLATVPTDRRKPDARRALEAPYELQNRESAARMADTAKPPRNLDAAIAWFREVVAEELPATLHKGGVWHSFGQDDETRKTPDLVGGSRMGSPLPSEPFRRFIENSPSETDADGFYLRPLRAALSRMERRFPLTARHLFRLALVDGDWKRHAANEGFAEEEMRIYLERALFLLWRDFSREVQRLQ